MDAIENNNRLSVAAADILRSLVKQPGRFQFLSKTLGLSRSDVISVATDLRELGLLTEDNGMLTITIAGLWASFLTRVAS